MLMLMLMLIYTQVCLDLETVDLSKHGQAVKKQPILQGALNFSKSYTSLDQQHTHKTPGPFFNPS